MFHEGQKTVSVKTKGCGCSPVLLPVEGQTLTSLRATLAHLHRIRPRCHRLLGCVASSERSCRDHRICQREEEIGEV